MHSTTVARPRSPDLADKAEATALATILILRRARNRFNCFTHDHLVTALGAFPELGSEEVRRMIADKTIEKCLSARILIQKDDGRVCNIGEGFSMKARESLRKHLTSEEMENIEARRFDVWQALRS